MVRCVALALAGVAPLCIEAKVVSGSFKLDAGGYDSFPLEEITKFSFGVGTSTIKGSFTYETMTVRDQFHKAPALLLIDDTKWDMYHNNRDYPTCLDKAQLSTMMIRIGSETHVAAGHSGLSAINDVESSSQVHDGMTIFQFTWEIEQIDRTHGWFFVVSDCALEQYQGVDEMTYRLEFVNEGMNHASAEENGLLGIYLISLAILLGGGVYGALLIKLHVEETERNVHLVVQLLVVAFILMLSGIVCETLYLWTVSTTGYSISFFDYASELLEMLSYLVTAFVLISIGSGWTLIEASQNHNQNNIANILRNPRKMIQGFNVVVVGVLATVVTSLILIIVNKQSDDSFHKFHDFESFSGKILIVMRMILGGLFAASMAITIKSMDKTKQLSDDRTMRGFLYTLLFAGTSYFMAFPFSVYIAETAMPHYDRHRFVEGSVILSQAGMLLLLGFQFLSHSSVYRRLSTVWESGLLPTAGGLQSMRKASLD